MIVRPEVWNKLTSEEKVRRADEFTAHLKSLPPQAPVDTSYLIELAMTYQTPVPCIKNGELDWGKYK